MTELRPSARELNKKIRDAREALKNEKRLYANFAKAADELNKLEIGHPSEVWKLIDVLLAEIYPEDYRGTKPPQKSYEKIIDGCELFAFSWLSQEKCILNLLLKKVAITMFLSINVDLENEEVYYDMYKL